MDKSRKYRFDWGHYYLRSCSLARKKVCCFDCYTQKLSPLKFSELSSGERITEGIKLNVVFKL